MVVAGDFEVFLLASAAHSSSSGSLLRFTDSEGRSEMRAVKDLPQMKPILLRKKNPGVTGSKDKWHCLHKFALYYSNKKLDYEALEAFDSEVDKDGTRKRLNASTSVIPVKHIVECRVSNNKKLVIILANKRVVTFKRREGTDVDSPPLEPPSE